MPQITVLTQTYNRETLLPRAIEAVLSQTFTDFTYLIVDNASTDHTPEIIEKYKKQDSRIQSIRMPENFILHPNCLENRPLLEQMKKLLYQPEDEFHFQLDDDDYMHQDTLEELMRLAKSYQADIATVGSQWVYPDRHMQDKYVFEGTYVYTRVQAVTELLKRERFNNAPGGKLYRKFVCNLDLSTEKLLGHDIYREYRRMCRAKRVVATGQPKYFFYRHGQNTSGLNTAEQITPEKLQVYLESNRERTLFLQRELPEVASFAQYCEASFMISLYQRIHLLRVDSCYPIADKMLDHLRQWRIQLWQSPWLRDDERTFLEQKQVLEYGK